MKVKLCSFCGLTEYDIGSSCSIQTLFTVLLVLKTLLALLLNFKKRLWDTKPEIHSRERLHLRLADEEFEREETMLPSGEEKQGLGFAKHQNI